MARWLGSVAVCLISVATPVEGATVEWRPTLVGGYSDIVGAHVAVSAALRVQFVRYVFVQPEYLVLAAGDHTDHGPTLLLGVSGGNPNSLRPYVGLGGGPVKGVSGDDGIFYLALGASYPLGRSHRAFIQGEFRYGLLGESTYSQFGIGVGFSR